MQVRISYVSAPLVEPKTVKPSKLVTYQRDRAVVAMVLPAIAAWEVATCDWGQEPIKREELFHG